MPGPKKDVQNTVEMNAEGKVYPWSIEGREHSLFKALVGYGLQMYDVAQIINRQDEELELQGKMTSELSDVNDSLEAEDVENVVGGVPGVGSTIALYGETAGYYYKPEQIPKATEQYKKIRKIQEEVSADLRSRYEGKPDAESRYYKEKADSYADMLDLDSKVADPEAGGIIFQAFFQAPYTASLRAVAGGTPKFGQSGFEECVNIMDQKDVPGGISIYDDYMTMMSAFSRELNVQYHRQQMEKEGWDADKEKTYLNELRLEHQKSIEAFDNLWVIDDHGQYDKALNNTFDDLVGKKKEHTRDANHAVGYMRGEVRAIDLGYDSRHLHILGQVGLQEQALKKKESEISIDRKAAEKNLEEFKKDPEAYKNSRDKDATLESLQENLNGIGEREKQLKDYKEEFGRFKEGLWNRKVNSKEEMQAAEAQVNEFFVSHQEKYKDLQRCQSTFGQGIDYNREKSANAPEISKKSQRLTTLDVQGLQSIIGNQMTLGGEEIIPNGTERMGTLMLESDSKKNQVKRADGKVEKFSELTEEFDKKCKDLAKEFSEGIERYRESHMDPDHPGVQSLRDGLLDYAKMQADALMDGRHLNQKDGPDTTAEYRRVTTLLPQLDTSLFDPKNLDKTEEVLRNYPVDKYIKQGLEIHNMETDYKNKKDSMTQKEKDAFKETLRGKKESFLDTAKDLYEKSLNPTPEILSLFGSADLLTSRQNGFIGVRGLESHIKDAEKEFTKTDIPEEQMDQLSSALDKISAKRLGLIDSEGDERKLMREQAERVQENLKKLKSGMVEGSEGSRPMTQDEKNELLADTIDGLNDLSSKTNDYIDHATKNGTKTPSGAGKTRLDGACELKDLANDLQETLMKEQQSQMKRERSRMEKQEGMAADHKADAKENSRKSVSFKELQEEEQKEAGQHSRRNSVREPQMRPKLEGIKHGENDVMNNNKAVSPRKK